MKPADLDYLRSLTAKMKRAAETLDLDEFYDNEMAFHLKLGAVFIRRHVHLRGGVEKMDSDCCGGIPAPVLISQIGVSKKHLCDSIQGEKLCKDFGKTRACARAD